MCNIHFAKIGEKTSEEASRNLAQNSADFKSVLPPLLTDPITDIPHPNVIF
jgi:uncharacterized lipoprotein YehR (DUF1307 family)